MIYFRRGLIFILLSSLIACSTPPTKTSERPKQDGAPSQTIHPSKIVDPKPKTETYSKYGNPSSYKVLGKQYEVWDTHVGYQETGMASWYGTKFHGQLTSSREPYDMYAMTAAHKNLPIPSYAKVTNLDNGKSIIVRINDRGPFAHNRIIDLSYAAATKLHMLGKGTARVKVEAIDTRAPDKALPVYAKTNTATDKIYLQVASFNEKINAESLAKQIKQKGHEAVEVNAYASVYRVLIGPFTDEDQAKAFHSKLTDLNLGKALVVKR
jgi:rare lipoprotein A